MAGEELLAEEEQDSPSFFDPIKEKGILAGGAELAAKMLPSTLLAGQWEERASDGFSVKDVFGSLLDVGKTTSYYTPLVGDALGAKQAHDTWNDPEADSLSKGLSLAGVIGIVPMAASVAALSRGGNRLNKTVNAARSVEALPVHNRHLGHDTLTHLAGVIDEPVKAQAIIATTEGTSKELMKALLNTDFGTETFDRGSQIRALRVAVSGESPRNAAQVEGIFSAIGDTLVSQNPSYRASINSIDMMDTDKVAVAAVAYESSKFDWLVRKGRLTVGSEMQDLERIWGRLVAGEPLTDLEIIALHDGIVSFADLTQASVHPEMAFQDIRVGVAGVHLDGPENSKVFLDQLDYDGVALGQLSQDDTHRRLIDALDLNESQVVSHTSQNITSFFEENIADALARGDLPFDVDGIDIHAQSVALGFSIEPSVKLDSAVSRSFKIAAASLGEVDLPDGPRILTGDELHALTTKAWADKLADQPVWIEGQGPTYVPFQNLLDMVRNPLPNKISYRNLPSRNFLHPQKLEDLVNPKPPSELTGSLINKSSRPPKVVVSVKPTGAEVVVPGGTRSKGRHRGTYLSSGFNEKGRHVRSKTPMRVLNIDRTADRIGATTSIDGELSTTGFRKFTTNHKSWAFEDGRHIVLSAPTETNHGADAVRMHEQLHLLLDEAGIPHTFNVEEPHVGSTRHWMDNETGDEYWSWDEIKSNGLEDRVSIVHSEEPRVQASLTFDDPDALSRAWHLLHEPSPHKADIHVEGVATVSSEYVRHYAKEYGIKRVPRGIKRELEFEDSGIGTSTEEIAGRTSTEFTFADKKKMRQIATSYHKAKKVPAENSNTARQYERLVIEVDAQYDWVTEQAGVRMEVVDSNPYNSPAEMAADIRDNKRLKVLSTESTGGHPLLTNEQNDRFRFIHDYFGHTSLGNSFSRHGEYVAYLKHSQMFSEKARGAMHSETVGQNAWLTFSTANEKRARHALRVGQSYNAKFSPQKATVLPKEFWSDKALAAETGYMTGADKGRRIDALYGEEILDIAAYTYGADEAPTGSRAVFEHHFQDEAGGKLVHMSRDGDVMAPNTEVSYVDQDGMYQFFGDSETKVHQAGKGSTGFTRDRGRLYWQDTAVVMNPESLGNIDEFLGASHRNLFDVKIDGEAPQGIAMYLPVEGEAVPLLMYNSETVPNVDPSRVVVLRKGSRVELPADANGLVDPRLVDDINHFFSRTAMKKPKFELKQKGVFYDRDK